ncbi:MAG: nitroreductase family protein [Bacillota bacterium]
MNLNFMEAVQARRSIRKFTDQPVPRAMLEQILEAARLAPSGTNRQPWRFVLLTEASERRRLTGAVLQTFVTAAPALFVCCLDLKAFTRSGVAARLEELVDAGVFSREDLSVIYGSGIPEKVEDVKISAFTYLDLGIAVEHMALQAASLGLGSCWVRLFNPAQVREVLGLPPDIKVAALLPVGYPAQDPPPRPRLSLEELLLQPNWQQS